MWQLQLHHGCHGLQGPRNELGGFHDKLGVQAVDCTQGPALPLHPVHKGSEDCGVGVELDLAGAVKDEVVIITIALQFMILLTRRGFILRVVCMYQKLKPGQQKGCSNV